MPIHSWLLWAHCIPLVVLISVLDGRHAQNKDETGNRRGRARRGHARDEHHDALHVDTHRVTNLRAGKDSTQDPTGQEARSHNRRGQADRGAMQLPTGRKSGFFLHQQAAGFVLSPGGASRH